MEYTAKELAEHFDVVISTIHNWNQRGIIHVVRKVKDKKSVIYLYDEKSIEAIKNYLASKVMTKQVNHAQETLCWTCINAYGGCSWSSKARKPVKGWKAKAIKLQGYPESTYKVLKCPLYEKELFRRDKKGVKRRVNAVK